MPHRFIAGVDIGASNVRVAIANEDGEIEARRSTAFTGGTPEEVLQRISRTIDDLARGVWVGAQAAAIGVALPGTVDPRKGTVASAANLPGWGEVPIREMMRQQVDAEQRRLAVAHAMAECVRLKPDVHSRQGNQQMSRIGG